MSIKSNVYKVSVLALSLICLSVSLPASAKMYKWVDDKGTTHYGETIPAEYANKDRAELNKSGVVVKRQDVLTPEERRAQEADSAQTLASDNEARDKKLHDKSLINTYSSVKEIELSQARNIQQVDARIGSINAQLKTANNSLAGLQKDVDSRHKAGKPIPPSLQDDVNSAQEHANRLQQDMDKYKAEKSAVEARYAADKARYKELTGK